MDVPRLGVEWELQLLAYSTATATGDLSHVCDLPHSSWQCRIPNPLSKAKDQTCNLMLPSRIHFGCATMGTQRTDRFNRYIQKIPSKSSTAYLLSKSIRICILLKRTCNSLQDGSHVRPLQVSITLTILEACQASLLITT